MTPQEQSFIDSVKDGAQAAQAKFLIPASITIAQAILESGWGKSLPAGSNNFFGIKVPNDPTGKCLFLWSECRTHEVLSDAEVTELRRERPWIILVDASLPLPNGKRTWLIADRFRRFDSPADCFLFRSEMLAGDPSSGKLTPEQKRYAPAMAHADDPEEFAKKLQECGYSTNPQYANTLAQLMTEFHLTDFDLPQQQEQAAAEEAQ